MTIKRCAISGCDIGFRHVLATELDQQRGLWKQLSSDIQEQWRV